jgi:tRNA pseudouridine55 synthase
MTTVAVMGVVVCDGVLSVRKPAGWTSHDVVARVRTLFKGIKVGHAGTLDPAATGVLPILVGRGTRIAEYLLQWDKEYRAVMRLGQTTDTQDATGKVLGTCELQSLTEDQIRSVVGRFRGQILQVPPMYSAVKVSGEPLYKSARAGRAVERQPRLVCVHDLDILAVSGPDVTLRVRCSKGTYVRTLCADIGEALGVGAHLLSLERTRVGPLNLEQALSIEQVEALALAGRLADALLSLDAALETLPAVVVDGRTAARVRHGVAVPPGAGRWATPWSSGPLVRVKDEQGHLLAMGRMAADVAVGDVVPKITIEKVLVASEANSGKPDETRGWNQ